MRTLFRWFIALLVLILAIIALVMPSYYRLQRRELLSAKLRNRWIIMQGDVRSSKLMLGDLDRRRFWPILVDKDRHEDELIIRPSRVVCKSKTSPKIAINAGDMWTVLDLNSELYTPLGFPEELSKRPIVDMAWSDDGVWVSGIDGDGSLWRWQENRRVPPQRFTGQFTRVFASGNSDFTAYNSNGDLIRFAIGGAGTRGSTIATLGRAVASVDLKDQMVVFVAGHQAWQMDLVRGARKTPLGVNDVVDALWTGSGVALLSSLQGKSVRVLAYDTTTGVSEIIGTRAGTPLMYLSLGLPSTVRTRIMSRPPATISDWSWY
jgi:hypothetical protein